MGDDKEGKDQQQQPAADSEAAKRQRKAPEKPFMVQVQVTLGDKNLDVKTAWVDVPTDEKIESAADGWKFVEDLAREGTYRVFQNCGEHELTVEKKTVATLK